jgi:CheY-like chemotaxis protein
MSHELRTPMNAIIGMSHLALQSGLNETQARYIRNVQTAAEALLPILNGILDLSKVEAGRLEMECVEFDLEEVFDRLDAVVSARAGEKGIGLDYCISPTLPRRMLGDPTRLGQVLLNLVSNAIKFTERGGVFVAVTQADGDAARARLEFEVRDTGIGMRPDQVERLFRPFAQADASIGRRFGGTGLGLAISRRLVEMMNGDISVDTVAGEGSRFRFSAAFGIVSGEAGEKRESAALPLHPAGRAAPALSSGRTSSHGHPMLAGVRLLLAEDNALNKELACELLRLQGAEVTVADNGLRVLERLEEQTFDGVLMDCQMPELDGYDTTRRLRRDARWANLPVIAMTADTMVGDRQRALAAGMNDHVAKPFRAADLFETVARWTRPSRFAAGYQNR